MHEKQARKQIEEDIKKRARENKGYDFTSDYIDGVEYAKNNQYQAGKLIKSIREKTTKKQYLGVISKYLYNADSKVIEEIVEKIEQDERFDNQDKADILFGVAEMFKIREDYMPWHRSTNQTPPIVGYFLYLEKALKKHENGLDKDQIKNINKKLGKVYASIPGKAKRSEECYKEALQIIVEEAMEQGKQINREDLRFPYELTLEKTKNILDEIMEMTEVSYNEGEYGLIRASVDVMYGIMSTSKHKYGQSNMDWVEQLREMRQLKLVSEYKSISYIPEDLKDEDRGNEVYRNLYNNMAISLEQSKQYGREMTELIRQKLENKNIGDQEGIVEKAYKDGVYRKETQIKIIQVMQSIFKEEEYYDHLAWLLKGLSDKKIGVILETTVKPMNENPIEEKDKFDDWLYKEYNKVADEQAELPSMAKRKIKNRKEKMMAYNGILRMIKESKGAAGLNGKEMLRYIEDMITCASEEQKYDYIAKGYEYKMYNMVDEYIEEAMKCFSIQYEISKMYGDKITGITTGIEFGEYLKESGYKEACEDIKKELIRDYEAFRLGNIFNNDTIEDVAHVLLDRIKQL